MGKLKQHMIEQEDTAQLEAEAQAASQEAYYWHCISEFYGMLKVFGHKKVLADINTFKESVDPKKEEPLIILPR